MTQSLLVAFTLVAVTAFAYPSDGTVAPTDDATVITASCDNHDDEVFASPSAESTQSKDGLSADEVQLSAAGVNVPLLADENVPLDGSG